MRDLEGKVAVVTGGASGIGRAVAQEAARRGMKVAIADIEEAPLRRSAEELAATGAEVEAVVTDVSNGAEVAALRDRVLSRFGAVHLVHNNAGVGAGGLIWTVSEADWRWVLGVNLWGVIHGIREFVPTLIEQGEGHVVNTASVAGLISPAFMGPYNASKHAVTTISETLYRDLRATGSTIGVSVLCPGFVQTGIAESDRNRPDWAPAPQPNDMTEQLHDVLKSIVAAGIETAPVATAVLDAVESDAFYILTHDDSAPAVEMRMHDILEGRAPAQGLGLM